MFRAIGNFVNNTVVRPVQQFKETTRNEGLGAAVGQTATNALQQQINMPLHERVISKAIVGAVGGAVAGGITGKVAVGIPTLGIGAPVGKVGGAAAGAILGAIGGIKMGLVVGVSLEVANNHLINN